MMMSPACMTSASPSTVDSVASPAGTMIHTARGAFSLLTKSCKDALPVAPSFPNACTTSAERSLTTHSWPLRMSRRTMLPPIRPSPTIPNCIFLMSFLKSVADRQIQSTEALHEVTRDVDAQRAALAFAQYLKVPACLRILHHAKGVLLSGNLHVLRMIGRNLQEHARVRTALVRLSRGVQEARTRSEERRVG